MFTTFEIKSYKQLEFQLGVFNTILLASVLATGYLWVLSPDHRRWVDRAVNDLSGTKVVGFLPLGGFAVLWGWIATQFLRLHDRLYDPIIRDWRTIYDSDFILRSLLQTYGPDVPEEFFEQAYADRRIRTKFLQQLFYDFIGDETETARGRRPFFYGEMARYWWLGLVDVYCSAGLLGFAAYALVANVALPPWFVIIAVVGATIARIYSNSVLHAAHQITADQITAIVRNHPDGLKARLGEVLRKQGLAVCR